MKKLIVIALAVVLALSVVAFVACGGEKTYEGEYSYAAWDYGTQAPSTTKTYGVKVHVSVKGGVITKVTVDADTEAYFNLTATDAGNWNADSRKNWTDNVEAYLKSFEGLTVEQVKAIKVAVNEEGTNPVGQPNGITDAPESLKIVTGATQSTARIILAVQNALKDVK